MRLFFHAVLGLSIGIVAAGLASGAAARAPRSATPAPISTHAVAREPREHPSQEQTIPPPEALVPRFAERVPGGAVLAWTLDPGTDGARLELSQDPAFAPGKLRHADVAGERFRLPASLPPGAWYWRLRGLTDGVAGERATPPRLLFVAPSSGDWG